MRRTKIVSTIGPASSKRGILEKMLQAGVDVARLNFSHGTHAQHAEAIASLRAISERMGKPLALLQDLCGPKVRLGTFSVPFVTLRRGEEVGFRAQTAMDPAPAAFASAVEAAQKHEPCPILPLPVPELLAVLKPGNTLLLDDGKIALRVLRCEGEPGSEARTVWARCTVGGELKQKKGVTAPGVPFSVPAVTEKDLDDLRFGLAQGVDWVAASYVRCAADLTPLWTLMQEVGIRVPLIAKIEKSEAVRNLDEILRVVEGIMVARGDLGVEMPFDEVPIVQKRIIRACNRAGKPVITATQMLESMIENARPTRAEATDVANAILDGTDAVMLSGETAVGAYPVEAVRTMARIAARTEASHFKRDGHISALMSPTDVTSAVARATAAIAEELNAKVILCATASGGTARKVAQYRPAVPILGVTTRETTYRQLALCWGVLPTLIGPVEDTDTLIQASIAAAQKTRMARTGDRVVLTAGFPVNNPGTTNLIEVHTIGQPLQSAPGPAE